MESNGWFFDLDNSMDLQEGTSSEPLTKKGLKHKKGAESAASREPQDSKFSRRHVSTP